VRFSQADTEAPGKGRTRRRRRSATASSRPDSSSRWVPWIRLRNTCTRSTMTSATCSDASAP